jgi:signal transduction histidine kinase
VEEMRGLVKKDQDIILEYKGEEQVWSDKKLVKNILINLLSNAIKFSGEGEKIHIRINCQEKCVILQVCDRGIGISEEEMQHLFSSFYRARNAINIEGTGLGLHIVKRYLDLLDGNIEVSSDLGKGTTFTVKIPNTKYEEQHSGN